METAEVAEHIWNKKADELTVGESLKVSAGVMVGIMAISIAIPVAVGGAMLAVEKISQKLRVRKFRKEMEHNAA